MYKFKFNILKEDIDAHVKNSMTEEEREFFKDVKFVPFNVHHNENMDIEVIVAGVLDSDAKDSETENSTSNTD